MGFDLREVDGGVVLKVKAAPGASRDRVVGLLGDALKVAVRVAPEKGKANKAILIVLAKVLGVPARSMEVVAGQTSRDKRILVRDLDMATVQERLGRFVG